MNLEFKNSFIDREFRHIRCMQNNMILLEKNKDKLPFKFKDFELIRACLCHDYDKFNEDMVKTYVNIRGYWHNKCLNISNESFDHNTANRIRDKHYSTNSHHIEYHIKNNIPISSINICEMCCDISAIAQEHEEEDYSKYFREELIPKFEYFKENAKVFLEIFDLLKKLNN